jgi:hypothetical protein
VKGRDLLGLEDNIKMDLKEIECEDVGWIQLSWDKVKWRFL